MDSERQTIFLYNLLFLRSNMRILTVFSPSPRALHALSFMLIYWFLVYHNWFQQMLRRG
jgi:hypothetical protein